MTPASIRNNNPGAMEPGPSSRKFGSTSFETLHWSYKGKPATNKIATFPTPVHGAAALFDLLYSKYTGSTVEAAITKWCGGYYADTYTNVLQQKCGVGPKDALTKDRVKDADTAIALAKSMAFQEAGREYPMSDEQWKQAHEMAFCGSVAPEPTPDNDVPFPKPEARTRAAIKEVVGNAVKYGLPTAGAGGAAHVATKDDSKQSADAALQNARKAVDKGKEVRSVVEDARGLIPPVPKSPDLFLYGGILAAVAAVAFLIMHRRSA